VTVECSRDVPKISRSVWKPFDANGQRVVLPPSPLTLQKIAKTQSKFHFFLITIDRDSQWLKENEV